MTYEEEKPLVDKIVRSQIERRYNILKVEGVEVPTIQEFSRLVLGDGFVCDYAGRKYKWLYRTMIVFAGISNDGDGWKDEVFPDGIIYSGVFSYEIKISENAE